MHINEPRQQLDHMLRETRIHLISFSQMADTKANILLSISSVLLSISLTKVSDPRFTGALIVLAGFLLITIFLALMTVTPRVQGFRHKKYSVHDPNYSPLFFGNYVDVPYDEYLKDLEEIMNDPDRTYEVMVKEIYYAGVYLVRSKYKYIRFGYLFFFTGLIISTIIFFFENFH
ncbi:MAG TPA: Pycsar system effector family protein [Anaerolineales bacterium]